MHPEFQPDPWSANQNPNPPDAVADPLPAKKAKKKKKEKAHKISETLFRTTLSGHLKLSEMADRKANLMISINSIIISVVFSGYMRQYDFPDHLFLPGILLLIVCLITIVVSLIATNPITSPTSQRKTAPTDAPIDLVFFGDFTRLTADDYHRQVRQLLSSEEAVYSSLINNIYAQGQVLTRKYRLLTFAYQFFMYGFTTVVVLVIIRLLLTYYPISSL